jgi:hypothetical protein
MANFSISPGVTISEIDNTFLVGQPTQAGAAIIGPTVKGPVETPTQVTSYSDFQTLFGDSFISGSDSYSYLTSLAAYNYFNYGGTSLIVARVVSGSYTPALSTVFNNTTSTNGAFASASFLISSSYTGSSISSGYNGGGSIKLSIPSVAGTYTDYWVAPQNYSPSFYNANSNIGYPNIPISASVDQFGQSIADFFTASVCEQVYKIPFKKNGLPFMRRPPCVPVVQIFGGSPLKLPDQPVGQCTSPAIYLDI